MTTFYRSPPPQSRIAPPAPWWSLLSAWRKGTFTRLACARLRRGWTSYRRVLARHDTSKDSARSHAYWRDVEGVYAALWSAGITVGRLEAALDGVRVRLVPNPTKLPQGTAAIGPRPRALPPPAYPMKHLR